MRNPQEVGRGPQKVVELLEAAVSLKLGPFETTLPAEMRLGLPPFRLPRKRVARDGTSRGFFDRVEDVGTARRTPWQHGSTEVHLNILSSRNEHSNLPVLHGRLPLG